MQFGQNDDLENDLFTNRMLEWLESQVNPDQYLFLVIVAVDLSK